MQNCEWREPPESAIITFPVYDLVPELWFSWLSQLALLLTGAAAGLLVYGYLADLVVFENRGRLQGLRFGRIDLIVGSILVGLFILLTLAGSSQPPAHPGPTEMIVGTVFSAGIFVVVIGGILASLTARHIRWRECFGLVRLGPAAVLTRAVALIAMALPLVMGIIALSRVLLAGAGYVDNSPQDIVIFLERNHSMAARWVVAIFAVVVAPMQEEFLFRGYLYGVMRRYAGPAVGTILNAALFAAIHVHLPSFGGLFALAVCLTLAYEWSGSLFVPMAMHAMFNSLTVIDLLSGGSAGG